MSDNNQPFHLRYRPKTLDKIIGHEQAVTRLKGMIASNKIPNALLFLGPSSAGKTTLGRAVAMAINGRLDTDYREINMSDTRSIDDVRDLIKQSKFRPRGKKRIFFLDESQGLISNAQAAAAILKPLEEPSPDTLWILGSMDPAKFTSGNGKAIANRCTQFVLEPHSPKDLLKQAKRIIKGEDMTYLAKDELLDDIINSCNGEMRTLANILQACQQYYEGLDDKPKRLKSSQLSKVLASAESSDDKLVVEVMCALYAMQYKRVAKALLDVQDGFRFCQRLVTAAQFMLNNAALDGAKHKKVWWTREHAEIHKATKELKLSLGDLAIVNEALVSVKAKAASFVVSPEELLSAELYRCIKQRQASK
ncbi:hypothetical protein [Burkholderia phage BCSR5]|nr:hypothetical protein [Burkholderia phage BCSR5]